ncbi:hypothetical protein ACFE04_025033 [Oxalis oulophora]
MAVVLSNLAVLIIDPSTPRTVVRNRYDVVLFNLGLPKRDLIINTNTHYHYFTADGGGGGGGNQHRVFVTRGKANSKVNGVDFDSDEENGNGYDEEERDWEKEMRMKMKELEDVRELEKKAEEIVSKADDVIETEEEKRLRVKKELEKVAQEQAERRATAQLMFDFGQKCYGKGMYGRSVEFFEGALTIIPRPTLFGGEIQIWLAMAYEADNRHADCINLYKQLESKHPSISIRRQASELRYILQAPKLKITREEMVTIPLIGSSYDSYAGTWTDKYKDKDQRTEPTTNQLNSSKDILADFLRWRPPVGLGSNTTFWLALTLWICLVGAAVVLQR